MNWYLPTTTNTAASYWYLNVQAPRPVLVFHKEKAKSWFVNAGKFKVKFIDVATGEVKEAVLEEGQTADFGQLGPHQVESLVDNSVIFEVGTGDYAEDRFRLAPGDTQMKQSAQ